jgi:hypothetical protein
MTEEQTITIDGKEYKASELSDKVKNELMSLRAAEQEMSRLQTLMALAQTARNAYASSIKGGLEGDEEA